MKGIWLLILGVSLFLMIYVWARARLSVRWMGFAVLQLAGAAILLYCIDMMPLPERFTIPINVVTVGVVAVFGLPGLALLAAVKWVLV